MQLTQWNGREVVRVGDQDDSVLHGSRWFICISCSQPETVFFFPLGGIWQYLETLLFVITGMGEERRLASVRRGQRYC